MVREVADLREEMQRQQKALAKTADTEKSYGALAASRANQFQPRYEAPEGVSVPKFENPQPWSTTDGMMRTEDQTDGVVDGQFVAPAGDFQPTTPRVATPTAVAPALPKSPSEMGQFVPPMPVVKSPLPTRGFAASASELNNLNDSGPSAAVSPQADPARQPTRIMNPLAQAKIAAAAKKLASPSSSDRESAKTLAPTTMTSTPGAFVAQTQTPNTSVSEKPSAGGFMPPTSSFQPLRKPAGETTRPAEGFATRASHTAAHEMGLEGYCCVSLMEHQKWVKGDRQWGCIHRGRLFLFASREFRNRFQQSPDMFSPLLGGADPVAYHAQGSLTDGMRKHGVFYGEDDGPAVIVLFANAENRAKFEATPAEYLRTVRQAMSRVDGELRLR